MLLLAMKRLNVGQEVSVEAFGNFARRREFGSSQLSESGSIKDYHSCPTFVGTSPNKRRNNDAIILFL